MQIARKRKRREKKSYIHLCGQDQKPEEASNCKKVFIFLQEMKNGSLTGLHRRKGEKKAWHSNFLFNNGKRRLEEKGEKQNKNTLSLSLSLQCLSCSSPYLVAYFSRAMLSFSL